MRLKYEPSSEPPHISGKELLLNWDRQAGIFREILCFFQNLTAKINWERASVGRVGDGIDPDAPPGWRGHRAVPPSAGLSLTIVFQHLFAKVNYTFFQRTHPGVELRANFKAISHRFHLFEVAFAWELTGENTHLPLGCQLAGAHAVLLLHLKVYLTQCFYWSVLKGQLPHKLVNL